MDTVSMQFYFAFSLVSTFKGKNFLLWEQILFSPLGSNSFSFFGSKFFPLKVDPNMEAHIGKQTRRYRDHFPV